MRCVRSLPGVLWFYRVSVAVMLVSILLLWSCSTTIPSYRYSEVSPKVLSPESSNNVNIQVGNSSPWGRAVPYIAAIGGTTGLGWFSWKLAKHHVRRKRGSV